MNNENLFLKQNSGPEKTAFKVSITTEYNISLYNK